MVKLNYHNTDITLYTITDMCQDFNKSRPYIKKTLDDIKEEYGEEMFDNHSCYSRLEEHLKRPALYVSDDIYNIIQQKVNYDRLKKKMINLLPDNTYELKQIILQQQLFFINQLNIQQKQLNYRQDIAELKRSIELQENHEN